MNQGWERMPPIEMRLPGLAWKILLMRSTHSRDRCRLLGKLYFTPMMRCKAGHTRQTQQLHSDCV